MEKMRTYTVQLTLEDTPRILISGKWLRKFGIDIGSKLKLIEHEGIFILAKIPDDVAEKENADLDIKSLEKQIKQIKEQYAL